jgi:hypothetical protein
MTTSMLGLPAGVSRLVTRANRGELQVRVEGLRESANLVYAAAQQLVFGVLAAGAAVIGYLARTRNDRLTMTGAALASALFLFGLLRSMWRGRRGLTH